MKKTKQKLTALFLAVTMMCSPLEGLTRHHAALAEQTETGSQATVIIPAMTEQTPVVTLPMPGETVPTDVPAAEGASDVVEEIEFIPYPGMTGPAEDVGEDVGDAEDVVVEDDVFDVVYDYTSDRPHTPTVIDAPEWTLEEQDWYARARWGIKMRSDWTDNLVPVARQAAALRAIDRFYLEWNAFYVLFSIYAADGPERWGEDDNLIPFNGKIKAEWLKRLDRKNMLIRDVEEIQSGDILIINSRPMRAAIVHSVKGNKIFVFEGKDVEGTVIERLYWKHGEPELYGYIPLNGQSAKPLPDVEVIDPETFDWESLETAPDAEQETEALPDAEEITVEMIPEEIVGAEEADKEEAELVPLCGAEHTHHASCYADLADEETLVGFVREAMAKERTMDDIAFARIADALQTHLNGLDKEGYAAFYAAYPDLFVQEGSEEETEPTDMTAYCGMEEGEEHTHSEACFWALDDYDEIRATIGTFMETAPQTCGELTDAQAFALDRLFDALMEAIPAMGIEDMDAFILADETLTAFVMLAMSGEGDTFDNNIVPEITEGIGLNVTPYLNLTDSKVQWHERHDLSITNIPWKDVGPGETIPADAHFNFHMFFDNLPLEPLREAGYRIYMPIQKGLDHTTLAANGNIMTYDRDIGAKVVCGTVSYDRENDVIVVDFNSAFVDREISKKHTIFEEGDFFYTAELNLKEATDEDSILAQLGNIQLDVTSEQDAISKYAQVEAEKSMDSNLILGTDGQYYIHYTLRLSADKYGCPDVKVYDQISQNGGSTALFNKDSYVLSGEYGPVETYISGTQAEGTRVGTLTPGVTNPKTNQPSLCWDIGDMGPNEVRELSYYVLAPDSWIGVPHSANDAVKNTVYPYSRNNEKNPDTEIFNPRAVANLVKTPVGQSWLGEDGYYYKKFMLTVNVDPNNSYPLTNVKVRDDLERGENNGYRQHIAYLPETIAAYIENPQVNPDAEPIPYDKLQSYRPYTGIGESGYERSNYYGSENPYMQIARENPNHVEGLSDAFELYLGDLNPGEKRYVTYTMRLKADEAQLTANGSVGFYNAGELWADDKKGGPELSWSTTSEQIANQTWTKKMVSTDPLRTEETHVIPLGSQVYDATIPVGSEQNLTAVSPAPNNFVVPAGSFRYSVVVNEKGEWDVTTANWADSIVPNQGNYFLEYTGYARVDVYDKAEGLNSDEAAQQYLATQTPKQTVFVKIDNMESFNFSGKQIGLDGSDAYVLTYYAKVPDNLPTFGQAVVGNNFGISGTVVGANGISYRILTQPVTVTSTVKEPGVNNPVKHFWYYDAQDKTFDRYGIKNGAMYWYVELSGSKIPNGMELRETVKLSLPYSFEHIGHFIRNNESFIGLYSTQLGTDEDGDEIAFDKKYSDLKTVQAAIESGEIERVPTEYYGIEWFSNGNVAYNGTGYGTYYDLKLAFKKDYALVPGEKLFMLVGTDVGMEPSTNGAQVYDNRVKYKTPTSSEANTDATFTRFGPRGQVDKRAGGVYMVKNSPVSGGALKNPTTTQYRDAVEFYELVNGKAISEPTNIDGTQHYIYKNITNDNNARQYMDLQHSLIVVADSYDELNEMCKSGSGYSLPLPNNRDPNDQKLNFTYGNGYYLTWYIDVNVGGGMTGEYTIIDSLPSGVELQYVRAVKNGNYSFSKGQEKHNNYMIADGVNINRSATGYSQKLKDDGWKFHAVVSNQPDSAYWATTLTEYYTKGNQFAVRFPNLERNKPVTLQVVAKVTTTDIVFEDTEFVNRVTLYDREGREAATDTAPVTLYTPGVSKDMVAELTATGAVQTTLLPYNLTINADGADMIPNADVVDIPLYDRMGAGLKLLPETMRIYKNDASNESNLIYSGVAGVGNKPGYNIIIGIEKDMDEQGNETGGELISFANLPDGVRLIISYQASATIGDGNVISPVNKAYWKGHENADQGESSIGQMQVAVGGSVTSETTGLVSIVKADRANIANRLQGAEFTLYATQTNEDGTPKLGADGLPLLGNMVAKKTTDQNGTVQFGTEEDKNPDTQPNFTIPTDTIFCIRETQAPAGYALDMTSHYFVIVDIKNSKDKVWPAGVTAIKEDSYEYKLSVFDDKTSVSVGKMFGAGMQLDPAKAAGEYRFGLWKASDIETTITVEGQEGSTITVNPTPETMLQSVSITYTEQDFVNGYPTAQTSKKAKFGGLAFNEPYYVFELRPDGQPILNNGTAYLGGNAMNATYSYFNAQGELVAGNRVTATSASWDSGTGAHYEPTVIVTNDAYSIKLTKNLVNVNSGRERSFTFILREQYANGQLSEELDRVAVTWDANEAQTSKEAYFENLLPDRTYVVSELDKNGNVLSNGDSAMFEGGYFVVSYQNNAVTITSGNTTQPEITFTNTARSVTLPHTGGNGTPVYGISGALLMALALILGIARRREHERRRRKSL